MRKGCNNCIRKFTPPNRKSPINPSPLLRYSLLQAHSSRLRRNLPWTTLISPPFSKSPSLQQMILGNVRAGGVRMGDRLGTSSVRGSLTHSVALKGLHVFLSFHNFLGQLSILTRKEHQCFRSINLYTQKATRHVHSDLKMEAAFTSKLSAALSISMRCKHPKI